MPRPSRENKITSNFYHAEQPRNYLSTNYMEEKAYSAVRFCLLRPVVLQLFDA